MCTVTGILYMAHPIPISNFGREIRDKNREICPFWVIAANSDKIWQIREITAKLSFLEQKFEFYCSFCRNYRKINDILQIFPYNFIVVGIFLYVCMVLQF